MTGAERTATTPSRRPVRERLALCSWSLQPTDVASLVDGIRATGLTRVQLALDPFRTVDWDLAAFRSRCTDAGIEIVSGMMATEGEDYTSLDTIRTTGGFRPDATWDPNRAAALDLGALAEQLGLDLVTVHAGFLPHDGRDPERAVMLDRLREIADVFAGFGVRLGLETGQETADTLLDVLTELERPTVGVNFDPANMLLYGMGDPIEALQRLGPHVMQVHLKDADPTGEPGTWGVEQRLGDGSVDWDAFFAVLTELGRDVDLVIEREAGDARVADIRHAAEVVVDRWESES